MGKIRWHGGVEEDHGVKRVFQDHSRSFSASSSFLRRTSREEANTNFTIYVCMYSCLTKGTRQNGKKYTSVYGITELAMCISVFVGGSFLDPQRRKFSFFFFFICPCVSRGDKSNLQMASVVEEHLNPISTRQTQMDHGKGFVVKEA